MEVLNFEHERLKKVRLVTFTDDRDVNDFYADFLIENNKLLSYIQENDKTEAKEFLKDIIKQKLDNMKINNLLKNDGVMMPFLSFETIKNLYNVEILYLFSDSDLERPKFGLDSVFVGENCLFLVEYKSHTNICNEEKIADTINEGVRSLFGKNGFHLTTLKFCKKHLATIALKKPEKIKNLLDFYKDNRNNPETLVENKGLSFNICIVSPVNIFNKKTLEKYVLSKYFKCEGCDDCKKFRCPRYSKIKINDVVHIQLNKEFNIEDFYKSLLRKLGVEDGN